LRLRRLNQGLDTRHWRVYEHRKESNRVRLVLSIDEVEMEALQWCGAGHILPSGRQVRGEEIKEEEEEEEEAEQVMVSTISFIQANLQHSIAASGILTRTVGVKGIDIVLVQEPWYREDCIRGLNIPGYTLYSARGKERPTACILARNMNAWVLLGFSCRDLVAILIKYTEDGEKGG